MEWSVAESEMLQDIGRTMQQHPMVESVTAVLTVGGRQLPFRVKPMDVVDGNGHVRTRPVLSGDGILDDQAQRAPPKRVRGPKLSQALYYALYRSATREMASPLEQATVAAAMGMAETTFVHYYYGRPAGKRYKTQGLGYAAPPGCRALGE